jgi:VIT1/CCC1 family predicted Fe2+/Mn2+ transporter
MAQHGRRRRRPSTGGLASVLAWTIGAAVLLVVVLILTGQPWGRALVLGIVGVVIVGGVTALVEITGVLNRPPAVPPAADAEPPDSDGASA